LVYDTFLADRIRAALSDPAVFSGEVREVKMFGGLSFMVNEKIAVSATPKSSAISLSGRPRAGLV